MAAPVVESYSTGKGSGSSATVTAPTGIQTGDLLLLVVNSIYIPSSTGFTVIESFYYDAPGTISDCRITTLYKIAVPADESTPNYTVTNGLAPVIATMMRISGWSIGNPVLFSSYGTFNPTTSGTFSVTDLSLERTNSQLLLMIGGSRDSSNDEKISNVQTYTITSAVSNPTWTEIVDTNQTANNGVTANALAVAYATTTESSDITGFSFAYTELGNDDEIGALGILLIIEEPRNAIGTPTLGTSSPTFFTVAGISGGNAAIGTTYISPTFFSVNGRGVVMPVWTNPTKPSTTWTNQTK